MMKTIEFLIILFICYYFSSCAGADYEPSPFGDDAEVNMKNKNNYSGEMLSINDSILYLVNQNKINAIHTNKINEIIIDKYSDRSWLLGVALLELVPSIVISSLAASYGGNFALIFGISLIPTAITALLFETSTPISNYENLNSRKTRAELKKFSRYPGGITTTQLNNLLKSYKQDSCIQIK